MIKYIFFLFFFFFFSQLDNAQEVEETNIDACGHVDSILNLAIKYIGKPYKSGGKGPTSFDCSGYTGFVFSQFGYSLAASSSSQYSQGEKISIENIKKGDLVFFKGRNAKSCRVGHVGIVCNVNKENNAFRFIHATSQGGVMIDDYPEKEYYMCRYIGAKRIIKNKNEFPFFDDTDSVFTLTFHKIKKGDTLCKIAKKYNCSVDNLMSWNNLKSTKLKVGNKLKVTSDIQIKQEDLDVVINSEESNIVFQSIHIVKKGDTLYKIAKKYNCSVEDLLYLNELKDSIIRLGQQITLCQTINHSHAMVEMKDNYIEIKE